MSTNLFRRFVNWMENGDLIPIVIAVSVPHYAHVLAQFDFWPVAAVIGFLVDVGHYRTIKLYLRDQGWVWMVVLTLFSSGFHISFYALGGAGLAAMLLGLAPTAVIFALAYITKKERIDVKMNVQQGVQKARAVRSADVQQLPAGTSNTTGLNVQLDAMKAGREAKKAAKVDTMLDIFRADPHAEFSAVAKQLNMSRTTVYTYLDELKSQGRVHVNGNGVEVMG